MLDPGSEIPNDVKDEVNTVIMKLTSLNNILAMKIKLLEEFDETEKDEIKKPSKLKKNGFKIESGLHRYFKGSLEYQMYQLLMRSAKRQN